MKKYLSALLVLALCLSAALAEEEISEMTAPEPPAVEQAPAPEQEIAPEPEPVEAVPEVDPPVDDMMFPEGSEPMVMPVPEVPTKFEGYAEQGSVRTYGTLEELLGEAGAKTVYVLAKDPVRIEKFRLALLKDVEFKPDPELGKGYAVALASEAGAIAPEDIAAAADEVVTLTVSVEKEKEEEPPVTEPDPDGDENTEKEPIALKVTPRNFTDGAWQNEIPSFLLEGIPADGDYVYAAIIYDERIIPLAGDEYFAQEEGAYAARFAILDAMGDIVDKSEKFLFMLDYTAPELTIEVSEEHDYTMTRSAA